MTDRGPSDHGPDTGSDIDGFADGSLDVPNCPSCLHRMDAEATVTGTLYWACANCGQTRVA